MITRVLRWVSLCSALALLAGAPASACACGCGVFDIGNVFRTAPGASVFAEYDWMDQDRNWRGISRAPAANNDDKDIRSGFITVGGQYLSGSGFGVMAEVPAWMRHVATTDNGTLEHMDRTAIGDVRLTAVYSGIMSDLGTGLTLGIKLPTGDTHGFDRDTAIGSGSTDIAIGAFHQGRFDALGDWGYVLRARYQAAFATQGDYRPGDEIDAMAAITYNAGMAGAIRVAPFLELLGAFRRHDSGSEADPANSGYSRILIGPGVEFGWQSFVIHAEAALPLYQNVIGNQLVAPVLLKTSIAYNF